MKLEVTEAAKKLLVAHGHQPEFGARPLRRTIQTELDNGIADLLLGGEAEPGDTIVADDRDGSVRCTVRKGIGGNSAPGEGPSGAGAEAERGSAVPAGDTGGD
jgi:ATP-dependent Clp protease ATP-binding subunit ClpC